MNWVYIKSDVNLWTVGFYDPSGKFQTDSDHNYRSAAAERCAYLNGASVNCRCEEEEEPEPFDQE
jgi:hypothetical protein